MIAEKLKAYNSTIIELKVTNQDFTSTSLVDKVDGGNSLVRKTVNDLFVEHLQRLEAPLPSRIGAVLVLF